MAQCKRQVKTTRHLVSGSCSNWVDFVKSGCEKFWAEVQADNFCFECGGCAKMEELEVEMEQLTQLVVALMGREEVGCASGSGGGEGAVGYKVGKAMREMLGRAHLSLGGGWEEVRLQDGRRRDGRKLERRRLLERRRRRGRRRERRRRERRRREGRRWERRRREGMRKERMRQE